MGLNSVRLAVWEEPGEFLDLHDAIRRLDGWDQALGELVRLRFSPSTAKRNFGFARAWLYKTLKDGEAR